jgi:hypothetical protein
MQECQSRRNDVPEAAVKPAEHAGTMAPSTMQALPPPSSQTALPCLVTCHVLRHCLRN